MCILQRLRVIFCDQFSHVAFTTIDLYVLVKPDVIVFYLWEYHLVSHHIFLAIKLVAFCYLKCSFTTTIGLFY